MAHHDGGLDGRARLGVAVLIVVRQGEAALAAADGGVAHRVAHVGHGLLVVALFTAQLLARLVALAVYLGDFGLVFLLQLRPLLLAHLAGLARAGRFLELGAQFGLLAAQQFAHLVDRPAVVVLGLDVVGEGRHLVELHLRPFVEGMVVALGALDAGAEEDAHGVGHVVERHAAVAHVVADGAVVPGLALGGDQLADEGIVGLVGAQGVLQVAGVSGAGDRTGLLAVGLHAQDIGPVVVEVLHVTLGGEQLVDQLGALGGILGGEEFPGFPAGRDAADEIEVDAAHEGGVIDLRVALEVVLFPVGLQQGVDAAGGLRRGGCRLQAGGGEGEGGEQARKFHHPPLTPSRAHFIANENKSLVARRAAARSGSMAAAVRWRPDLERAQARLARRCAHQARPRRTIQIALPPTSRPRPMDGTTSLGQWAPT